MPRFTPNRFQPATPRSLGVIGLLALYLFSFTPLALGITSLLALVEGNHQVEVQATTGGIELVLHHSNPGLSTHRHGWLARALTGLTATPASGNPDHLLLFGPTLTADQAPVGPQESEGDASVTEVLSEPLPFTTPSVTLQVIVPPSSPGALQFESSIRSTVLLI